MLPAAAVSNLGACVDFGDERPTACRRVSPALRQSLKGVGRAIRCIQVVNLRSARPRMPGIAADLLHGNRLAQIQLNPAPRSTRSKEEVL